MSCLNRVENAAAGKKETILAQLNINKLIRIKIVKKDIM